MDFLGIPGLLEPDQVRDLLHPRQSERAAKQKATARPDDTVAEVDAPTSSWRCCAASSTAWSPPGTTAPASRTASPTPRCARSAAARPPRSPPPTSCARGSTGSATWATAQELADVSRLGAWPAETSQTLDRGLRVLDGSLRRRTGRSDRHRAGQRRLGVNRTVVYRLVAHPRAARAGPSRQRAAGCTSGSACCTSPRRSSRCCATSPSRCCVGSPRRSAAPRTSPSPTARRRSALAVRRAVVDRLPRRATGSASRHPLDQGAAGKAILLGREAGDPTPYAVDQSGELQHRAPADVGRSRCVGVDRAARPSRRRSSTLDDARRGRSCGSSGRRPGAPRLADAASPRRRSAGRAVAGLGRGQVATRASLGQSGQSAPRGPAAAPGRAPGSASAITVEERTIAGAARAPGRSPAAGRCWSGRRPGTTCRRRR